MIDLYEARGLKTQSVHQSETISYGEHLLVLANVGISAINLILVITKKTAVTDKK